MEDKLKDFWARLPLWLRIALSPVVALFGALALIVVAASMMTWIPVVAGLQELVNAGRK